MSERTPNSQLVAPQDTVWIVLAIVVVAAMMWAIPAGVVWLHDGSGISAVPAIKGTVKLVGDQLWAHPRWAYPAEWREHMPHGTIWWAGAGWVVATFIAAAFAVWRCLDSVQSQNRLGREPRQLRGSRPRRWAKRRDLSDLADRRASETGRFSLGSLDHRQLWSDPESHVTLVAPTRSGKTSRYVIPWLLEHDGPAIVTSTKTDVLEATRAWREKQGAVTIWDPFGTESGSWTPLTGCEDWQHSIVQAKWLADAAQEGESELASFWRDEASRLLAPLLHAAAQTELDIQNVVEWVDQQDTATPTEVLTILGADSARIQLEGIAALDPRNRSSVYMSAASLLAAYRLPAVRATARPGLSSDKFFNGKANTLYIVASSRQQRLLTPLIVAIISGLLHAAAELSNERRRPLDPTLRVLLDETANIAPLRDLPSHLAQLAGHGVRIATVWQSLAQAKRRYGAGADEILANSAAQLYLGPVTDQTTRGHIQGLLGDEQIGAASVHTTDQHRSKSVTRTWRPKATAATLQQLDANRALLVEGRHPPAIVRSQPWWEVRRLRRRADAQRGPAVGHRDEARP